MRALPGTAGCIVAALCLTACEDRTITGLTGTDQQPNPTLAVTPARLSFRIYALVPERDPAPQTLAVGNTGGTLTWSARSSARWLTLLPAQGTGFGGLRVQLNRGAMPIGLNGFRPASLTGVITVSAKGAANPEVQIPVAVSISYLPRTKLLPGEDPDPLRKPVHRGTIGLPAPD